MFCFFDTFFCTKHKHGLSLRKQLQVIRYLRHHSIAMHCCGVLFQVLMRKEVQFEQQIHELLDAKCSQCSSLPDDVTLCSCKRAVNFNFFAETCVGTQLHHWTSLIQNKEWGAFFSRRIDVNSTVNNELLVAYATLTVKRPCAHWCAAEQTWSSCADRWQTDDGQRAHWGDSVLLACLSDNRVKHKTLKKCKQLLHLSHFSDGLNEGRLNTFPLFNFDRADLPYQPNKNSAALCLEMKLLLLLV